MCMKNIKTLTGVPWAEVPALLDKPLPPEGYKPIRLGSRTLTDICPNWTKRILSLVFGPCGYGWGFEFSPENLVLRFDTNDKQREIPSARVVGVFWYVLIDGDKQVKASFPVTGASKNEWGNEGYSLKGSITNAIGCGASMIGFQESVFLKQRDHTNTTGQASAVALPYFSEDDAPPPAPKEAPPANPPKVGSWQKPIDALAGPPPAAVAELENKPSLADKVGIKSKWYTCLHCGHGACKHEAEPCPACENCGVVAGEAFVWSPSADHWMRVQKSTNERLAAASVEEKNLDPSLPAGKRELQALLKQLTNDDRGLVLQALSEGEGKSVNRYSDASVAAHQKAVKLLQSRAATTPPPSAPPAEPLPATNPPAAGFTCPEGCGVILSGNHPCPICQAPAMPGQGKYPCPIPEGPVPARAEVTRQIYQMAGKLGCADFGAILRLVSESIGLASPASRMSDLSEEEVVRAWRDLANAVRGK